MLDREDGHGRSPNSRHDYPIEMIPAMRFLIILAHLRKFASELERTMSMVQNPMTDNLATNTPSIFETITRLNIDQAEMGHQISDMHAKQDEYHATLLEVILNMDRMVQQGPRGAQAERLTRQYRESRAADEAALRACLAQAADIRKRMDRELQQYVADLRMLEQQRQEIERDEVQDKASGHDEGIADEQTDQQDIETLVEDQSIAVEGLGIRRVIEDEGSVAALGQADADLPLQPEQPPHAVSQSLVPQQDQGLVPDLRTEPQIPLQPPRQATPQSTISRARKRVVDKVKRKELQEVERRLEKLYVPNELWHLQEHYDFDESELLVPPFGSDPVGCIWKGWFEGRGPQLPPYCLLNKTHGTKWRSFWEGSAQKRYSNMSRVMRVLLDLIGKEMEERPHETDKDIEETVEAVKTRLRLLIEDIGVIKFIKYYA
ncbi:hypothetical protein BGZ94_006325 [Podila epigama]|nr:hypothetical protein BGZ94_006325 [Podila epigama]